MRKLYLLANLLIFSAIVRAQNVGIGTTEPTTKLQVAGNILVSEPSLSTNTAPTAAQTKTMVNGGTITYAFNDSTGRFYDPGGPSGNYIDNLNANVFLAGSSTQIGVILTIESIDLETGDSLLVKINSFTAPSVLAFGKGNQATGNFTVNTQGLTPIIIFKSNGDGVNGQGFSVLFKRLFETANPGVSNFAGNSFYFNSALAATRGGAINPADEPGIGSTAFGNSSMANGFGATAFGYNNLASGDYAFVAGGVSTAAERATAIGHSAKATGYAAIALGESTTASGNYSVALGSDVSTNGFAGAFFFGDSDPNHKGIRTSGAANQFVGRFNGGYYLISSNAGASDIGVQVLPGGNSWSAVSDVRRKENFIPVDGESFLQKIGNLHLTTWNYKGQDAKTFRHYGPMAQEFFAAFGKDELGTIGCDTLINQHDFLGVNLIAIQALEKRTTQLQKENEELKARLEKLEKLMADKRR